MNTITKEQLIEELKASTQNASGMFEIISRKPSVR